MKYQRSIESHIEKNLFKGKVIVLYGARRTGKTTLSQRILAKYGTEGKYINCELQQNKQALETTNNLQLKDFLGNSKLIVLDEAQVVQNIGLILKILVDTYPETQIIATGSSSFDMAQSVSEPLTGRSRTYTLYPLSLQEITAQHDSIFTQAKIENILRFGTYPSVFNQSETEAKEELRDIATNYLYKDVLQFKDLRRSDLLMNLLQALALQLGNEVSYTELATLLGENHHTIKLYIELLEKCFVIFRLRSFSRNLRKELGKSFKVYFFDLGIRNSLINNFNPMNIRTDVGALWENFCILERMKKNHNARNFPNTYFWRTYDQKEVDYIEEEGGVLHAYEIKWDINAKIKHPSEFLSTYPESTFEVVTKDSYDTFLLE